MRGIGFSGYQKIYGSIGPHKDKPKRKGDKNIWEKKVLQELKIIKSFYWYV